jgi:hypothetical protein
LLSALPPPLPQERGEKRHPQGSLSHWVRVGVRISLKKFRTTVQFSDVSQMGIWSI